MYISAMAKRTRDPEGRRKKILQAAGELIEEIGISAVTHRKVAERARVPLGSTTQYFKSLTDMLAEALTGLEEEREEKLAELNEVDDPVGLVADMVMESLADLKRTRNEMSFALLYTPEASAFHRPRRRGPGGAVVAEHPGGDGARRARLLLRGPVPGRRPGHRCPARGDRGGAAPPHR